MTTMANNNEKETMAQEFFCEDYLKGLKVPKKSLKKTKKLF